VCSTQEVAVPSNNVVAEGVPGVTFDEPEPEPQKREQDGVATLAGATEAVEADPSPERDAPSRSDTGFVTPRPEVSPPGARGSKDLH
jgi:hypothetical protein